MTPKARHAELLRALKRAAEAGPDVEVEAEDALLDALAPHLDAAGYHVEDRAAPAPKPTRRKAPPAARAAKALAASPAPKLVITVEQC